MAGGVEDHPLMPVSVGEEDEDYTVMPTFLFEEYEDDHTLIPTSPDVEDYTVMYTSSDDEEDYTVMLTSLFEEDHFVIPTSPDEEEDYTVMPTSPDDDDDDDEEDDGDYSVVGKVPQEEDYLLMPIDEFKKEMNRLKRLNKRIAQDVENLSTYVSSVGAMAGFVNHPIVYKLATAHKLERDDIVVNIRLLSQKVKGFKKDYDRMKGALRDNVSERIESISDMLLEMRNECASELEKQYSDYVEVIQMMKLKMEQACEENMLLLLKSIILQSSVNGSTGDQGWMTQPKNYAGDMLMTIRMKTLLDQKVDMLLMQNSAKPNLKSHMVPEEFSGFILQLNKYAEKSQKDEVQPELCVGEIEVEDDSLSAECKEDGLELNPCLLELQYFEELTKLLPGSAGKRWMESISDNLHLTKFYASILEEQETTKHDMLEKQAEYWDKECHFIAGRLCENNAQCSRQVELLTCMVSDVTDQCTSELQIMSDKFRGLVQWMKSRTGVLKRENIHLATNIARQQTEPGSVENNFSINTVKHCQLDAQPTNNGHLEHQLIVDLFRLGSAIRQW